jgi:hydroxymethylglutaryl-CoA synthase
MLLEEDPQLAVVDLPGSGSASDYRVMDFRKPMMRFCGQDRSQTHQVQDFPIFNGKYSTTCYIDETLQALDDMYRKRDLKPIEYLRSLKTVFMHRPYRRMPETGWAVAYLFALSQGSSEDRAELASYCYEAGIDAERLRTEMMSQPKVSTLASPERLQYEIYPLTMAALRVFRASRHYRVEVLDKLALGSDTMLDLGNLYTAALPAWLAAGFEQARDENRLAAGEEVLTLGYGSGDAAEVIPFYIADGWREATEAIGFSSVMDRAVDLSYEQYAQLHEGQIPEDLVCVPQNEFVTVLHPTDFPARALPRRDPRPGSTAWRTQALSSGRTASALSLWTGGPVRLSATVPRPESDEPHVARAQAAPGKTVQSPSHATGKTRESLAPPSLKH